MQHHIVKKIDLGMGIVEKYFVLVFGWSLFGWLAAWHMT